MAHMYCTYIEFICVLCFFPESYLGHNVKNAVITVPAYFNDSQRQVNIVILPLTGYSFTKVVTVGNVINESQDFIRMSKFFCDLFSPNRQQRMPVRLQA